MKRFWFVFLACILIFTAGCGKTADVQLPGNHCRDNTASRNH